VNFFSWEASVGAGLWWWRYKREKEISRVRVDDGGLRLYSKMPRV
jgi:hypothetical protein